MLHFLKNDDDNMRYLLDSTPFSTKQPLSHYTQHERARIESVCRDRQIESPWTYAARNKKYQEERAVRQSKWEEKQAQKVLNDELPRVEVPSVEFRVALQKARSAKGWKQKDLAQRLAVRPNLVQQWEAGSIKPNPQQRQALNRLLKVKLPMK